MTTTHPAPVLREPASDERPAVRVRGLVKRYERRAVVDGVDLDVRHGEVFALLGPNGAGKTTTVEILAGLRTRDGGSVEVLGEDPAAGDRRWRDRVGVVGQTTGAGNALTVRETLDHYRHYHARPVPTDELLSDVGLAGVVAQRVDKLSGGQRRRLEVALGVQGRPEQIAQQGRRGVGDHLPGPAALRPAHGGGTARRRPQLRRRSDVDEPACGDDADPVGQVAVDPTGEVPDLTVTRPGLEDVYVQLVATPEGAIR